MSTSEGAGGRRAGRSRDVLRVCVTCRWRGMDELPGTDIRPGQRLYDLVMARAAPGSQIHPICCLSNCFRACNAVLSARGKAAIMLSEMAPDEATADALLATLGRYAASGDGMIVGGNPDVLPVVRALRPGREPGEGAP